VIDKQSYEAVAATVGGSSTVSISHTITQCEQGMASMSLLSDGHAESVADVVSTTTPAHPHVTAVFALGMHALLEQHACRHTPVVAGSTSCRAELSVHCCA
jgi:hypothetical protein